MKRFFVWKQQWLQRHETFARRGLPAIQIVLMLVLPIVCFYLMEAFDRNPFEQIRPYAHLFNIILFEIFAWFFFFVTGRAKWALRILYVLALIFGLTNHYVTEFRSTPFMPWDIFSIRTAASVVGEYHFTMTVHQFLVFLVFILIIVLVQPMNLRIRVRADRTAGKLIGFRLVPAVILVLVLVLFSGCLQDEDFQTAHRLYPYLFTPNVMVKYNGQLVTFVMDMKYVVVSKPSDYNKDEAAATLASYEGDGEEFVEGTELPNIIVIMDEAFSDLAVLGDFSVSEDYMPFVHSLMEGADNTVSGYLHVSVCGGNTANTEWEFLTGNTMAFLPSGSIPFQQYLKRESPSVASHLASLGYSTTAIHPYNASGWNRDTAYPLLGIDTFLSLKNFSSPTYIRNYVSDESSFAKVIDVYESKEAGQPAFIFNVTMQNHGSYTSAYDNFTPQIAVAGASSFALSQYLSLIRETDSALENLIDYFSGEEEPTMIIFFGDHQPADSVVCQILSQNGMGYKTRTPGQMQLRDEVPYSISAHCDIGEATGQDTSANYLAAEALTAAGLPLSAYQNYLMQLREDYPIISAVQTDGDTDSEELKEYNRLEYYLMFDYGK